MHKKWCFPLKISSRNCGFSHTYWRNPKWEISYFCENIIVENVISTCYKLTFPLVPISNKFASFQFEKQYELILGCSCIFLFELETIRGNWYLPSHTFTLPFQASVPLHRNYTVDFLCKWFLHNDNTTNLRHHLFHIFFSTFFKTFFTSFLQVLNLRRLVSQKHSNKDTNRKTTH